MTRHDRIGPLLVTSLGVAVLVPTGPAAAQTPPAPTHAEANPPTAEVIVSARRLGDEAITATVVQVLRDDPYLWAPHISVVTENGVVRLQGFSTDPSEVHKALRLAQRAAGKRRVLNEVELFISQSFDSD